MSYEKVKQAKRTIIGTKQAVKAIRAGIVNELVIARDADERVIAPVIKEAEIHGIPLTHVDSKQKLGAVCGIDVSTAVIAITE